MPDPWAEFHLEDIATEHATRHRLAVSPRGFEGSLWVGGGGVMVLLLAKENERIQCLKQVGMSERPNQLSLY